MQKRAHVDVARPRDADAVAAVLKRSYPALMAAAYAPDVFARALPLMTRANPALLRSGRFYLARMDGVGPVGCGGWSLERPDAPTAAVDPALGHVRHFATDPDATRRGIGRALFERCAEDARAAGVRRFECYSSFAAVAFYRALGFRIVAPMEVAMGPDLSFPSMRMEAAI